MLRNFEKDTVILAFQQFVAGVSQKVVVVVYLSSPDVFSEILAGPGKDQLPLGKRK